MKQKTTGKTTLKAGRGRPRKEANWTGALLLKHSKYYFDKCDSRTRKAVTKLGAVVDIPCPAPYTIEGLCLHLGIATTTFRRWWEEGGARSKAIGLLRQKITENRVVGALDGVQNPSFARFMLTNNNPEEYAEKVNVESSVDPKLASIFDAIVANKLGGK
jgi:hypothetical protein